MNTLQDSQPKDIAEEILRADRGLDDIQRADLFDAFHDARDENHLVDLMRTIAAPGDVKYLLQAAKQDSMPPVHPATEALTAMNRLDPALLALAEKNPTTAQALISLAKKI